MAKGSGGTLTGRRGGNIDVTAAIAQRYRRQGGTMSQRTERRLRNLVNANRVSMTPTTLREIGAPNPRRGTNIGGRNTAVGAARPAQSPGRRISRQARQAQFNRLTTGTPGVVEGRRRRPRRRG